MTLPIAVEVGDLPMAIVTTDNKGIGPAPAPTSGGGSFFGVCKRDAHGWCTATKGGAAAAGLAGGQVPPAHVSVPVGGKTQTGKIPVAVEARAIQRKGIAGEKVTPPPPGQYLRPSVHSDHNGDGVTDQARVGVGAFSIPPPPPIPRLPNLTARERAVEKRFAEAYEKNPDGMASQLRNMFLAKAKAKGGPPEFGTDDAKELSSDWRHADLNVRSQNRATLNAALHQTANAVTKRAFVQHLDTLKPGDEITVTVGGCHGRGTPVVMYDGSVRPVEEIGLGDLLMGPDSTPRRVLRLVRGHGRLYLVTPNRGDPFVVDENHILSIKSRSYNVAQYAPGEGRVRSLSGAHGWLARRREFWSPDEAQAMCTRKSHRTATQRRLVELVKSRKVKRSFKTDEKSRQLETINIRVADLLRKPRKFQSLSVLYRTGVDFSERPVPLAPYFLGLWLGDGTVGTACVTTADPEIADYLKRFAAGIPGARLVVNDKSPGNRSKDYRVSMVDGGTCLPGTGGRDLTGRHIGGPKRYHPVLTLLRETGVYRNKYIPDLYLRNSRSVRLAVLAGLLDSDGYCERGGKGFQFSTKFKALGDGVVFLARSLGFGATMTEGTCADPGSGERRTHYSIHIEGNDLHEIPTLIVRKRAEARPLVRSDGESSRNVLHSHYKIEYIGEGDYYGFKLDGDHLYLLGDFTVTHNCGAGKGYGLKNVPEVLAVKNRSKAVWDSAGDQNATENPWIQHEAEKRGLKVNYVYVHADPYKSWADPERGAIKRAGDPNDGRMVDAKVFADSYVLGAKNFKAFMDQNVGNPRAAFYFIDNTGKPKGIPGIPDKDLVLDSKKLTRFAEDTVLKGEVPAPPHVVRGALIGRRIWAGEKEG